MTAFHISAVAHPKSDRLLEDIRGIVSALRMIGR